MAKKSMNRLFPSLLVVFVVFLALFSCKTTVSEGRFQSEIEQFVDYDKKNPLSQVDYLFMGSSSIRLWKSLQEDMHGVSVLNRGFGGATIAETNQYFDIITKKYKPRSIVFYCGENDITENKTPKAVFEDFKAFVSKVENKDINCELYFISMKPSISRWHLWQNFEEGNEMIKNYCDTKDTLHFIDVGFIMMINNSPDPTIFIEDGLHMNAEGYARWTKLIRKALKL